MHAASAMRCLRGIGAARWRQTHAPSGLRAARSQTHRERIRAFARHLQRLWPQASCCLARRRSQRATGATRPGPGGHTGRAIPPDAAQSAGSALAAHGHPVQSGRGVTVSQALEQPVAQLHHELQRASVCHADETRHQSHSHTLWRGYWSVGGASSPHDLACGMHHQLKLLAIFLMAKHPRPVFVKGMPIVESFFHLKTATFSLQLRWHPYQAQLYCDFGFGLKFGFFIQPPCSWTWARLFSQ